MLNFQTLFVAVLCSCGMLNAFSQSLLLKSPSLLGDTRGPSFTLNATGGGTIEDIETSFSGNIVWYTDSNCAGPGNSVDRITTGSMNFSDGQTLYFGEQALYSIVNSTSAQCVLLGVKNDDNYVNMQIRGLDCSNGSACTGGTVCNYFAPGGSWSITASDCPS